MRSEKHWLAFLWLALLMSACGHKDLCLDHRHQARVRVNVDWSKFTVETPTGMSVLFYPADGGTPSTCLSNELNYVELNLPPARYHCLVYNQSPSEFGTVTFAGMEHLATATVNAKERASRWFRARAENEMLIMNPEWIATDHRNDIDITQAMVEATAEAHRISRQTAVPAENVVATLTPENIVCTIVVTIHLKGIYNLRSARASLDGLAAGYHLGQGKVLEEKATQLLEEWSMETDPYDATRGTITARIHSFGLPVGHGKLPEENWLRLSLLLVDGQTQINHDFPVGDSFREGVDNEVSLYLERTLEQTLPDVKPAGSTSGGFDATVDDWDDDIKIEINT